MVLGGFGGGGFGGFWLSNHGFDHWKTIPDIIKAWGPNIGPYGEVLVRVSAGFWLTRPDFWLADG